MADTFTLIQSVSLVTNGSIIFTNIPQTYTDLVIITSGVQASSPQDMKLVINGDTNSSNYKYRGLYGYVSGTAQAGAFSATSYIGMLTDYEGIPTTTPGTHINVTTLGNYTGTAYKISLSRSANAYLPYQGVDLVGALWKSSAAITQIELTPSTWANYSHATLYGVKAA
jgi:hypothetical protein